MDDLISRQAAIEAVLDRIDVEKHGRNAKPEEIQWTLEKLPSPQQERLTDDDFETIRIHLNAYKEKLCNQQRWKEAEEYQRIIDRFMAFASAQPENRMERDVISRQAAIKAFKDFLTIHDSRGVEYLCPAVTMDGVNKILSDLPSAQPERKTGQWLQISPARIYECSECGQTVMTEDIGCYKYCHGCGAYMGGDEGV